MKSALETLLAAQMKAAGIGAMPEYRFCPWRKWRADFRVFQTAARRGEFFTLSMENVLVEVQGGGFVNGGHSRGMGLERDCEKMATAAALGWRVLPVTGRQIKNGAALALIEAALGLKPLQAPPVERKARKVTRRQSPARKRPGRSYGELPVHVRKAAGL